MKLSMIIPVMNEADNIARLFTELLSVAQSLIKTESKSHVRSFEIIFVDDGSSDNTLEEIKRISPVVLVSLRRNFGQTAALDAGIKNATGDILVTLDGDLQNDPSDIPHMLKTMFERNLDVVCGWRKKRQDNFSKRVISSGARMLRGLLVKDGVHDAGCTLRVYRRECFDDLDLRGEMHRFIPALLNWRGFSIGEVTVNHRPRIHGKSKYNLRRTLKAFLDMLSLWFFRKFSGRPLHFLGSIGLLAFQVGLFLIAYLGLGRALGWFSLAGSIWPLMAVFLMLFGIQMFVSGLIMDLILSSSHSKHYVIKEVKRIDS